MNKRGQITLFVIAGILIVVAVGIFVMFRTGTVKAPVSAEQAEKIVAAQVQPILDVQEKCARETALVFFNTIGYQAGYYDYSLFKTVDFAGDKVIVIYKKNNNYVNKLPGIEDVQDEFDRFMNSEGYTMLDNCTKGFSQFKRTLDEVSEDKSLRKLSADINDDNILMVVEWPLTIKRAEASTLVGGENFTLLIPLGSILTAANDVASIEMSGQSFAGEAADNYFSDNDARLKRIQIESPFDSENQKIFSVKSTKYRTGEEDYLFYFAIDHN